MMPKISVRPLATRNSSSPYWTAFRHWIRKVARSIRHNKTAVREFAARTAVLVEPVGRYILQPRAGSASALTATF